ncbi:pitrilysin family protein [Arcobacter sp. F2176]|uniref:M16 family metallopeptidase n=1 Tax=Arcobacter sp. F2176 TaxID=2044511 RepID=UPI00100BF70E|nr:pitrilysin family protein [Arcobacter sp. F2176]RXJ82813.1 peptidase M16 [Arcobacter sp. F2176]
MGAQIEHIKIENTNIPIIFEEQHSLPTFNLQLVFKNSGSIKDKDKNGLAGLSARLLNEGTLEDGSTKFAQKLENLAISLNVSHGFETFVIELSSIKDVYKNGLELLKELIKSPNYKDESLEKVKTILTGSLKRKENDFDYVSRNELNKILFKGTSLENPSSGTTESISKISLDDVKNFINSNLVLENLIIVAGGDITLDEVKNDLTPLLSSLKHGKESKMIDIEASDKKVIKEQIKETEQAYIYFGSPFDVKVNDENNYIAKVASFILGGSGFGSRLMEEIRVKRGLAYSAYGQISINKSHTYFTGYLQTKNETANEAKDLVNKIVDEFVKKGITKDELEAAKSFLTGSEPLRVETLSQRLNRAFTLYYRGLNQDYSTKELEKIEELSLKQINDYVKSHTEIKNLSFSIVRK